MLFIYLFIVILKSVISYKKISFPSSIKSNFGNFITCNFLWLVFLQQLKYLFENTHWSSIENKIVTDYLWNLPRRKIITSKGTLSQNHEEFRKKRKLEEK